MGPWEDFHRSVPLSPRVFSFRNTCLIRRVPREEALLACSCLRPCTKPLGLLRPVLAGSRRDAQSCSIWHGWTRGRWCWLMLRDPLPCRRELSPRSEPGLPKQVSLLLFQSLVWHFGVNPALLGGWERHGHPGDAPWRRLSLLPMSRVLRGLGAHCASATADLGA